MVIGRELGGSEIALPYIFASSKIEHLILIRRAKNDLVVRMGPKGVFTSRYLTKTGVVKA